MVMSSTMTLVVVVVTLAPVTMTDEVAPTVSSLQIPGENASTPSSPAMARNDCGIAPLTPSPSPRVEVRPRMACPFKVVVAIDFGTTSSGYAFSFTREPEAIHMMNCGSTDLTMETDLEAVNGRQVRAIEVFAHALRFFREHALKEVKEQSSSVLEVENIRW
ncbi:hypothetical protein CRUP_038518, partial [Coryphaenoides rupestris]